MRASIAKPMSPSSQTPRTDRLPAIAGARRARLQDDDGRASGAVAGAVEPWIAASWQRCMGRGQRPRDGVGFDLVTHAALRHIIEASRALRTAARPVLADLDRGHRADTLLQPAH